jgi:hypothetical protein
MIAATKQRENIRRLILHLSSAPIDIVNKNRMLSTNANQMHNATAEEVIRDKRLTGSQRENYTRPID